jgi:excisionase family DNA binding protein
VEKPNNHVVEDDGWLTPKEIAPKIRMSKSGLYSLIRRGSTIPYVRISKKKILLNWASVDQWLHDVEAKKKRANFEE